MVGDWEKVRLGDLVKITHGWPFKSECFTEERTGRPIIVSIGNFQYTGGFRFESTTIKEYTAEYPKDYELTPGDILLVMTCQTSGGEILGIPGRIPDDGNIYLHNQRMGKVVIKERNRIDLGFVYYLSLWSDFNRELCVSASGTKILHTAPVRIEAFEFKLPPLAEQKAIAAVLGALDDKIEVNRRMNATLETMARALFQSWFVDFDPVRAKLDGRPPVALDPATAALFPANFHDSPIGHIPTDWNAIPLYDAAQWVNGGAFKSEDFCATGEGLPVIKIAELKDGISAQTKWCQRAAGADKIIDTGDLVYSWSGSPDTSLEAFLWSGGRGLLNQHIFKVISATAAEKRFVYYLLQYLRPVLVETARNKQTTGLGHVTIADMKRLLVCMPSKAVLAAFDRNVSPIFDKACTNTLESRTLATLRDSLLPKLLSGELSVAKACLEKEGRV